MSMVKRSIALYIPEKIYVRKSDLFVMKVMWI